MTKKTVYNNINNIYITLTDASKLCDYSQEYLSLRARQGKLKAVKQGRNWVTTKEWLDKYIQEFSEVEEIESEVEEIEYVSLQEAAKKTPYSQEYLSLRARQGKLKAVKQGRNWVTTKEWVSRYLQSFGEKDLEQEIIKKGVEVRKNTETVDKREITTNKKTLKENDILRTPVSDLVRPVFDVIGSVLKIIPSLIPVVFGVLSEFGKSTWQGLSVLGDILKIIRDGFIVISIEIFDFIKLSFVEVKEFFKRLDFGKFKKLKKIEDLSEEVISQPIDKGLAFVESVNLKIPKVPKFNILRPKFIVTGLLIASLFVGSFLAFNPGALAALGEWKDKSVKVVTQAGEGIADFIFNQSKNAVGLAGLTKDKIKDTTESSSEMVGQAPQLIEKATKIIEEIPENIVLTVQNWSKGIKNANTRFVQKTKDLGSNLKIAFTQIIKGVDKLPEATIELVEESSQDFSKLSQKNEEVKRSLKSGLSQLPEKVNELQEKAIEKQNQTAEIVKELPGTVDTLRNSWFQTIRISAKEIKDWGQRKTFQTIAWVKTLPDTFDKGFNLAIQKTIDLSNKTIVKVSNFNQAAVNHVKELPDSFESITSKEFKETKEWGEDFIEITGDRLVAEMDKGLAEFVDGKDKVTANIFENISSFNSKLSEKISSATSKTKNAYGEVVNSLETTKNKFGDTYLKVAEFLIPGYKHDWYLNDYSPQRKVVQTEKTTITQKVIPQIITKEEVTQVVQQVDLTSINKQIAELETEITNLKAKLASKIDYTVPSYAPIYVPSSGIQVAGHSMLSTLNVSGSGSIGGSLNVRQNMTIGNTQDNTTPFFDVYADSTFHRSATFDGGITAAGITVSGNLGVAGNSNLATTTVTGDFIVQNSDGTRNFYIQNNTGNVGIGTTTPNVVFAIESTNAVLLPVGTNIQRPDGQTGLIRYNTDSSQFEGYANDNWTGLGGVIDVDQDTYIIAESSPGADEDVLFMFTSSTERMRIANDGNVGIGTTTPDSLLTVVGGKIHASSTLEQLRLTYDLESSKYGSFTIDSNGDLEIDLLTTNATTTFPDNVRVASNLQVDGALIQSGATASFATTTITGDFTVQDSDSNRHFYVQNNTGYVGIGTTNPGQLLQLGGVSSGVMRFEASDGDEVDLGITTSDEFYITGGDIGIGTTNPDARVHVVESTDNTDSLYMRYENTGTGAVEYMLNTNSGLMVWGLNASGGGRMVGTAGAGDLVFSLRTGGDIVLSADSAATEEHLVIKENGNVGIGVNDPVIDLAIGDSDTGLQQQGDGELGIYTNNSEIIRIDSSGNVGIASTTPGYKLSVEGDAYFADSIITSSITATSTVTFSDELRVNLLHATTTDFDMLQVNGNATTTGTLSIGNDFTVNTDNLVVDTATGNVGIGTASPGARFEITGKTVINADDGLVQNNNEGLRINVSSNNYAVIHLGGATGSTGGTGADQWVVMKDGLTGDFGIAENSGTKLTILSTSGNVGIGTTSPYAKLSVVGQTVSEYFTATSTSATSTLPYLTTTGLQATSWVDFPSGSLQATDTSLTKGYFIVGDDNGVSQATSTIFVSSGGNVGIGTAGPDGSLHVHTATAGSVTANASMDDLVIENSGAAGASILTPNTATGYYSFGDVDENHKASIRYDHSVDEMYFYANQNTRMTIDSDGNVGIGTTSPGEILHIAKSSIPRILLTDDTSGHTDDDGAFIGLAADQGLNIWNYENTYTRFSVNNDEKVRITNNGNVGIGTTTPKYNLSIEGATNPFFQIASSTNQKLLIVDANGNIGVNTTTPTVSLSFDKTDAILLPSGTTAQRPSDGILGMIRYNQTNSQFEGYSSGNWTGLGGVMDVDQDTYILAESTPSADEDVLFFYTAGNERGRWDADGNLGIGTTSPGALLDIYRSSGGVDPLLQIGTSTDTDIFVVKANGNVGIGTSSPTAMLSIQDTAGQDAFRVGSTTPHLLVDESGNIGIGTANPEVEFQITGGIMARGNGDSYIPSDYTGAQMFWYPAKRTFRAGYWDNGGANNANIGVYSIAMGFNAKASGQSAVVLGAASSATAVDSVAIGPSNTSQSLYGVTIGRYTKTGYGEGEFVIGRGVDATTNACIIIHHIH